VGYGIYTTRFLKDGESILGAPDGVGIPVEAQNDWEEPKALERKQWHNVWGNYWWGRGVPDHVVYEAPPDIMDYQTGFGVMPNHHCVLDYLDIRYPDPPYIDSYADRFRDAGAGAFSYNRGREFTVTHDLEPGSEIFL